MKVVPKSWGEEHWIHNDEKYCGKKLILKAGKSSSLHFHVKKYETLYVESGQVKMEIVRDAVRETIVMNPGDFLEVTPGLVHRFEGVVDSEIMEFSTQHFDEDSYRIERPPD